MALGNTMQLQATHTLTIGERVAILLVAGCGFLVDVYDSVLFAVVRIQSFTSLQVPAAEHLSTGVLLFNLQMTGMVLGGAVWGVLGDKIGRRSALFGSIFLYSLANLLNAFVDSVPMYGVCRFISGFGLAGEVGAAMTMAAEIMPPKYRTYGTAFVSVMGVLGSLLAAAVGDHLPWRWAFASAAIGGFLLLVARLSTKESQLFTKVSSSTAVRGSIKMLVASRERVMRIARCVFSAMPLFFLFGILISFAPEIWNGNNDAGKMAATVASLAMYYSLGETAGEVVSGVLSQLMQSRKRVMYLFLSGAAVVLMAMLYAPASMYPMFCFPAGFLVGYWGIAMTTTAEQFGTNLRATASTLVPNLMRATVIPMSLIFGMMSSITTAHMVATILAVACVVISFVSVHSMEETFGKDLDFIET
ncbi:MAG TPA: MFS transporter [Candidatus Obscuribacterales bacterium]